MERREAGEGREGEREGEWMDQWMGGWKDCHRIIVIGGQTSTWTPTLLCPPKSSEPVPKTLLAPLHAGPHISVTWEPFPRTKEAPPEQ